MDASRVGLLRDLLESTPWVRRSTEFAGGLRRHTRRPGGLLVVGTPQDEPWHLTAHLDEEARHAGLTDLVPTLVRHAPPPGAPPHLAVGLDRLERAGRGETLFVVSPDAEVPVGADVLERLTDARRVGATVLALDTGDPELESVAHDALVVPGTADERSFGGLHLPEDPFEVVGHLVSSAVAADPDSGADRRSLRRRLNRVLDMVSGPVDPPRR